MQDSTIGSLLHILRLRTANDSLEVGVSITHCNVLLLLYQVLTRLIKLLLGCLRRLLLAVVVILVVFDVIIASSRCHCSCLKQNLLRNTVAVSDFLLLEAVEKAAFAHIVNEIAGLLLRQLQPAQKPEHPLDDNEAEGAGDEEAHLVQDLVVC